MKHYYMVNKLSNDLKILKKKIINKAYLKTVKLLSNSLKIKF